MDRTEEAVAAAVAFLRERVTRAPAAVLVLGSGMGAVADSVTDPVRIGYDEIPGFPRSTVAGHRGSLEVGRLGDVEVAILRGRFHAYEGWSQQALTLPLRVLAAFGARSLVVTNAAGGIARWLTPGDLMLIHDHINFQFRNPLIGGVVPGDDRFPDMSDPYDPDLRALADATAAELGIALKGGVYAAVLGPSYETPAEISMLQRLGADVVGMSTVPEVTVARALGMAVVGFSIVTNRAAGTSLTPLTHDEVLEVAARAGDRLSTLLRALLPRIGRPNPSAEVAA